jgi:CheY-like chemotaxis protein
LSSSNVLRILVAEDNEFNAQLLEQLLLRRGHRVRLANNGREALSLLGIEDRGQKTEDRKQKSENRSQITQTATSPSSVLCPLSSDFDLVLLDVHMPELDGFQVVQAVRERERTAGGHLPVIALTARSRQEDREQCLAAGMDDFLAKPIQAADLWSAIDRVLRQNDKVTRWQGDKVTEKSREPITLSPGHLVTLSSAEGLLDPRVLLAACGDDAAILEKICQALRTRLPDHVRSLRDALREGDPAPLRETAHKLCGILAAFSTVAGGVASELEDQAARGRLDEAPRLVEQLEAMAHELMQRTDGLSLDSLRRQAEVADDYNQNERTKPPESDAPARE